MQEAGEVTPDLDADRTAAAILAGIQGGVVMMMSTGDITPLEAALDLGIAYLRSPGSIVPSASPLPIQAPVRGSRAGSARRSG